jgi:hypothetical protein
MDATRYLRDLAKQARLEDDRAAKLAIEACEHDQRMIPEMELLFSAEAWEKDNRVSPDQYPPPQDEIPGDVEIGKVKQTGKSVRLLINEFMQGVLISGRSGAGKTNLLFHLVLQLVTIGVIVWVFETAKISFRHIMPADTLIIPYRKDRFNPWSEPPGVDPMEWEQIVCEITATTFGLQGASKHAGLTSISQLSDKYGTYRGCRSRFTMPVFYKHMLAKRKKASWTDSQYLDRWLNKLEPLNSRLFDVFNVNKGFPLENWVDRNVIWELTGLTSELQAWFVNMKLAWKLAYKMANPHLSFKPCINVFDEGSRLLLQRSDNGR